MRLLKISTVGLLIQGILLSGPVQARMIFDSAARENMSPALFIQDKELQTAFKKQISSDYIIGELVKNNWSLEKTANALGIGRKKLNRIVGKDIIEKKKKEQRLKEIELEKDMIICALQAYRWNVALAAKETGIWTKRIRELIPIETIQRNRAIAEQQLKELMIKVLEENEWNVVAALQDQRLVEQEIGKNLLYQTLTVEWISAQRNIYNEKIENQQKQEIITAIKIFMYERNCLEQVRVYLKLAKGTLNDRIGKYGICLDDLKRSPEGVLLKKIHTEKQNLVAEINGFIDRINCLDEVCDKLGITRWELDKKLREYRINVDDIRYSTKRVLPILEQTNTNATRTAEILGLDRLMVGRRFFAEIAQIRHKLVLQEQRISEIVSVLEKTGGNAEQAAGILGLDEQIISRDFADEIIRIRSMGIEKQKIIDAVNEFINSRDFWHDLGQSLEYAVDKLKDKLNKHKINVYDIRYSKERVVPVLEQTCGNVKKAAEILGLDRQLIRNRFAEKIKELTAEKQKFAQIVIPALEQTGGDVASVAQILNMDEASIIRMFSGTIAYIKQMRAEKQELLLNINRFVNSRNCLRNVAKYLDIGEAELKHRLKAHNIEPDDIRYSPERIIPVLVETGAQVSNAARILKLNREVLSRRFGPVILAIQENRYHPIEKVLKQENTLQSINLEKKQELIEVIMRYIDSRNWLKNTADHLGITELGLTKSLNDYNIQIDNIRYSAERVMPVLEQTDGNIKRTAARLDLDIETVRTKFTKDIAQIKAMVAQRQELIKVINKYINSGDCQRDVGEYLGIDYGTLKDRLSTYKINIYEIEYSRERVLPVLIETEGNLTLTAEKLGLDTQEIEKRFLKEIEQIKNSSQIVWLLYRFEMLDKYLESLSWKISDIDAKNDKEVMSLCRVVEFIAYRGLVIIEEMQKKANEYNYPIELREMINFYEKRLISIEKVLAFKPNDPRLAAILLEIVEIEIRGTYNKRIDSYAAEQFILMHGNSLLESAQAEILINNSI